MLNYVGSNQPRTIAKAFQDDLLLVVLTMQFG